MKKLLIASIVLFAGYTSWAVTQAQYLGVVSASLKNLTAAQVILSTSTAKGEIIFCSDCGASGGAGTLCVSTATAVNSFVLSTGTVCK